MLPEMEGDISSQRGTFDMSPDIEDNIYYLVPKVLMEYGL
jgi:hypothetical protein